MLGTVRKCSFLHHKLRQGVGEAPVNGAFVLLKPLRNKDEILQKRHAGVSLGRRRRAGVWGMAASEVQAGLVIWFSLGLLAGWLWEETKAPLKSLPEMGRDFHFHSIGVSRRPLFGLGLYPESFS